MHNNWITGMDKKIYRQKEMHLFVFDINHYYTSISHKYIKIMFNSYNINTDEIILKYGLYVASLTKSILILPQFKCNHCSSICNYCSSHTFCSFIEFWNIREFNKIFKEEYRESVYNIIYYYY